MLFIKRTLLILVAAVFAADLALAASANFNVQIRLRTPISVTKLTDLNFGTVETGSGTQTVNASAGPHSAGTAAQAASFSVSGEASAVADVTLPATVVINDGGSNNLTVTLTAASATHTFTGGTDTFYVGGSVDVASAPAGLYTGSATFTLIYQ